jgi:hypothetical protein
MGAGQQGTSAARALSNGRKKAVTMSQEPPERTAIAPRAAARLKIDLIGDCDFFRNRATIASDGGALSGESAWI